MKHRVLVADDDDSIRQSLKKILVEAKYEVVLAADGQEAIERCEASQIDLLVLDLGLTINAGWEVSRRLASRHPLMPIIIITGLPNQQPIALAEEVVALLEKPIDAPLLLETIRQSLATPRGRHPNQTKK